MAISILHRGIALEPWLVDVRAGLAKADSLDLAHGASFHPPCTVRPAPVEEMAAHGDAIVVVTHSFDVATWLIARPRLTARGCRTRG